jgi:hypothetical protein
MTVVTSVETTSKLVIPSLPSTTKKELELIEDKSNVKLDITHYINVFATSGLLSFYVYFPPFIPYLYKRCKWLLGLIAAPIIVSALYPVDEEYQPQV